MKDNIRNKAIDQTLSRVNQDVTSNKALEEFADLDNGEQIEIINIIFLALKNIVRNCIIAKTDINIPYIGILKIKEHNKFAIRHKLNVANELGYNNYNEIPKDKIDLANIKVRELVRSDIKQSKTTTKKKRVSHQKLPKSSVKVLKFNLIKT